MKKNRTKAPNKQRTRLDAIAGRLDKALKAEAGNIIAVGKLLITARDACAQAGEEFLAWLSENFGMSRSTAYNYMGAADYAKRFPTVGNGRIAPRVLYDLANGEFDEEVAEQIRKEARIKRVDNDRAQRLVLAWQIEQSDKGADHEPGGEDSEPDTQPLLPHPDEIEQVLEGPPPDVPPPEPAPPANLLLPVFDDAIAKLKRLATKPLGCFAGTTHTTDDLQRVTAFLCDVAKVPRTEEAA